MWIAVAVLTFAASFATALAAVRRVRRRPFALDAPLALALVVAFEALALDVLSAFHAVTRAGVLAAHAAVLLPIGLAALGRGALVPGLRAGAGRGRRSVAALGAPGLLVAALFALAALSAVRFAPNNHDAMTYRLARVAHWIQHRSVEPYPTHVDRQVVNFPGAEYVLATLQVVSGSDRLAAFLQLLAWVLVVVAAPPLARVAGAPRALSRWAAVIVSALPMGVLQASGTQNDLVAAALAVAGWIAALPFLHRRARGARGGDVVLLAAVLAAATLVKATAVIAAAPVVAIAAVRLASGLARGRVPVRPLLGAFLVAVLLVAAVVGPEVLRRREPELARSFAAHSAAYLYPARGELGDRAANLARGLVRHLPAPRAALAALGVDAAGACSPGDALCGHLLLRAHEDYAGNPLHVLLAVGTAIAVAVRGRRLPGRARMFLGCAAAAWVLFHLTFRDNAWISRLETPTFVLTGLSVAAAAGTAGRARRRVHAFVATAALVAIACGASSALENESRPPIDGPVTGYRAATYYANRMEALWPHDSALRAARRSGCARLGLAIGGDSYDYPLTWRAMQEGIEVRHVFGPDPWPCLVFTDPEAPAQASANGWRPTKHPFLFANGSSAPTAAAP